VTIAVKSVFSLQNSRAINQNSLHLTKPNNVYLEHFQWLQIGAREITNRGSTTLSTLS